MVEAGRFSGRTFLMPQNDVQLGTSILAGWKHRSFTAVPVEAVGFLSWDNRRDSAAPIHSAA